MVAGQLITLLSMVASQLQLTGPAILIHPSTITWVKGPQLWKSPPGSKSLNMVDMTMDTTAPIKLLHPVDSSMDTTATKPPHTTASRAPRLTVPQAVQAIARHTVLRENLTVPRGNRTLPRDPREPREPRENLTSLKNLAILSVDTDNSSVDKASVDKDKASVDKASADTDNSSVDKASVDMDKASVDKASADMDNSSVDKASADMDKASADMDKTLVDKATVDKASKKASVAKASAATVRVASTEDGENSRQWLREISKTPNHVHYFEELTLFL